MIQAGREDKEIIPTLEKYGSIERMAKSGEEIFQDIEELTDLRTVIEKTERAKEQWYNLPEKIRQIFNNNVDEYVENGMSWAEKMKERIKEDTQKSDEEKLKK